MICLQNGPLNCTISSPECTKNHYFETKNGKKFSEEGHNLSSPDPSPSGEGDSPSSHPIHSVPSAPRLSRLRRSYLGAFGTLLDHWVPPRFWNYGYGPANRFKIGLEMVEILTIKLLGHGLSGVP